MTEKTFGQQIERVQKELLDAAERGDKLAAQAAMIIDMLVNGGWTPDMPMATPEEGQKALAEYYSENPTERRH